MIVEIFASTDVGRNYEHNEDNFAVCRDLSLKEWIFRSNEETQIKDKGAVLLVADGMGGTNAGEVASNLAQQSIRRQFDELESIPSADKDILAWLKRAIILAHEEIVAYQISHIETAGMGTTLTILWVFPGMAYVAWCGDSRVYLFRENASFEPVTDDHSYVWELVKRGELTPEEARVHPDSNIITQSLGTPSHPPKPEAKTFVVQQGDRILLCSDGLNSMLSDQQIQNILSIEKNTIAVCKRLVDEANLAGGRDNITSIVLDVKKSKLSTNPPSISQEYRKKNKTKNAIIVIMGILLVSVGAYSALNNKKSRVIETPKLIELGEKKIKFNSKDSTVIYANQLIDKGVDSIKVAKPPVFGKVSSSTHLSLKYEPENRSNPKNDSLEVFLYGHNSENFRVRIMMVAESRHGSTVSNANHVNEINRSKEKPKDNSSKQERSPEKPKDNSDIKTPPNEKQNENYKDPAVIMNTIKDEDKNNLKSTARDSSIDHTADTNKLRRLDKIIEEKKSNKEPENQSNKEDSIDNKF